MQCFLVDAFADRPFSGNPAAVCILDDDRPQAWLQAVAQEWNQAETAFVQQRADGWHLRWFTPQVEVDLCGHATLAAAQVVWQQNLATGPIHFHTRSGVLSCAPTADHQIRMRFPRIEPVVCTPPEDIDGALGARVIGCWQAGADIMVEVDDAATLRTLRPDMTALATIETRGIIVTAGSDDGVHHCISRFFAPRVGISEDSVTGSAHCALGPLWAKRLQRRELLAFQASPRGGHLRLEVADDHVHIIGTARIAMSGVWHD